MAAGRGGWPTLERTPLADVADRLWHRRGHWLARCAEARGGRCHGDAVPGNFLATRGEDVVAVDWQCFGIGPVGSDLGYYALSTREELDVLADTFAEGAGVPVADVLLPARVTAVYTVLSRTEWALRQAAKGEGALLGKLRHPAVAPHVRALQRQFAQIEALL
jgi:aminoglycoside phosphotransferase (APT) family kinase protein